VPIARGGLVPGTLYSYKLNIEFIYPIYIKSYEGTEQSDIGFTIKPDAALLRNKKILVVDDLSDTGNTFEFLRKFFIDNDIHDFKTHSLYIKTSTKYIPDLFYREFRRNNWLVFPWESDK
jgi:hypoxanthine phosphoribosyltransferase